MIVAVTSEHVSKIASLGGIFAGRREIFRLDKLEPIILTDEDLTKPLIGVALCGIEITPCNWNHRKRAEEVKRGIRDAGGTPIEFNTISVTDGIAMGTEDKTIPGMVMAMSSASQGSVTG